tara:strand:+ start:1233 stop:2000 length:768 start_codon:yes stop_codon:yes gene_type:complete
MKIGIIQGRLSPPTEGFQDTPKDWRREFDLLPKLGLNHIEWVVTKESFEDNPLFTEDISAYTDKVSAICADNLVNKKFHQSSFLDNNLGKICYFARQYKIKNVVIPLLEESSISNDSKRVLFEKELVRFAKKYPEINFLCEIEEDFLLAKDMANLASNIYLVYDTGNINGLGYDHKVYIKSVFNKIKNVHLKDRLKNTNQTLPPGKGNTDFKSIFNTLKDLNYDGLYTMQTAREVEGKEEITITKHKKHFEKEYE